jgi:diacylglycerol kinase family enzyme
MGGCDASSHISSRTGGGGVGGSRAHPGDGRLDLVEAHLGPGDRLKARRRLPRGEHVPHPRIRIRQVTAEQLTLDPPTRVWLDGTPEGRASALSIRVEPAALLVVV